MIYVHTYSGDDRLEVEELVEGRMGPGNAIFDRQTRGFDGKVMKSGEYTTIELDELYSHMEDEIADLLKSKGWEVEVVEQEEKKADPSLNVLSESQEADHLDCCLKCGQKITLLQGKGRRCLCGIYPAGVK